MRSAISLLFLSVFLRAAADDDWPRWRGPADTGVARGSAPVSWSDTTNVAWKVPIAGRGFSSPVIWGTKLFLTTAIPMGPEAAAPVAPAEAAPAGGRRRGPGGGAGAGREHKLAVLCLDRNTGKTLWEHVAIAATPHEGFHAQYGSFASNSPVTDGKLVYAFFGSRGVYAYDLNGKLSWKKEFSPMRMRNAFGEGVAPVLDEGTLYLKFDAEEGSYMVALDKRTGKEIWRVEREEISSWSPPLVVKHNGSKQVIVSATNKVRSYEPATGKLLWEAAGLGVNVIPAPVTAEGLVYVMSGFRDPKLMAIKLDAKGNLTGKDSVVWTSDRGNSYTPSPVLHEGKLYFVTDSGMLSCVDAATGKEFYKQQRLPKPYNFKASPVAADGKLYLASENEDVVVVRMGERFEIVSTNTMPDQTFIATPAIADGSIYLRSQNTLYCIRQAAKALVVAGR